MRFFIPFFPLTPLWGLFRGPLWWHGVGRTKAARPGVCTWAGWKMMKQKVFSYLKMRMPRLMRSELTEIHVEMERTLFSL